LVISPGLLDHTGFNISYLRACSIIAVLFDRAEDKRPQPVTQQIYGPFRLGVQTSLNLDTGERISTDFTLEYSRRTYGIALRYNPELELVPQPTD